MASKKERKHDDLKLIENYCSAKIFSRRLAGQGEKANLRWTAKWFSIKDKIIIIADKDRQVDIIHDIHEGSGDTRHSKAMSAHLGKLLHTKKLLHVSFGMGFTTMLQTT